MLIFTDYLNKKVKLLWPKFSIFAHWKKKLKMKNDIIYEETYQMLLLYNY